MGMKAYVILVTMLAITITVTGVYAEVDSKVPPEDQPNFHPKITKEKIDGKDLDIVEFQCKLAK